MKYYYVTVDKNYIPPMPLAWFGLIDRKTLERKKSGMPPKYMRFFLDESIRMTFTDIITSPCFMASEMVWDVIKRYEPSMKGMRIVLCDKARRKSRAYYIPYLERVWIVSQIKGNPRCMPVERQCLEGRKILEVTDGAVQGDYEDGYGREHFEKGCTRYRAGRDSDGTGKQHMKKEKKKKRITGTERALAELE